MKKRNETPRNATPDRLTPAQELAVAGLLAGKTITDAAADAQVDRATVHRWLRTDAAFIARLNAERLDLRRAAYGRLEKLAEAAVGCLERAVVSGDAKIALEIVRDMGILVPSPIGPEDATEVGYELDRKTPGGQARQDLRELFGSMDG